MIKDTRSRFIASLVALLFPALLTAQPDETYGIGERELVTGGVSSAAAELVPRLNHDGTRLYFVRKEAATNVGGVDDQDDIYYSDLQEDGTWGEAVNIGAPLNTPGSDVLFWISEDEKSALLYHGRKVNGRERGLSIARKVGNTWGEPERVSIEGVASLGNWYYASISPDRKYLLLAYAPDPQKEFNLDLFYAPALSDDLTRWGKPEPILAINSPFIEASPWLSRDGRTLYFISDRPDGLGLADVFISQRPSDSWTWWSPPESIGYTINSPSFESDVSLSSDERWIFTSRAAGLEPQSIGRTDIYRHTMPERMESMFASPLDGILVDKKTGEGIRGSITISIQRQGVAVGTVASDNEGRFSTIVLGGHIMTFSGSAPGYSPGGSTFDGRFLDPGQRAKTVRIELERGEGTVVASGKDPEQTILRFATGSAALSGASRRALRTFATLWNGSDRGTIRVDGYTDSVGTTADNLQLSRERATSVARFMEGLGIPLSKILTEGHGEADPRGDNGTAAGRSANRRVEIEVRG